MNDTAKKIYCQLGIVDENLTTWESAKTFGLIGENTKVHKGESLFPRLDIEKEVEELNELFSEVEAMKGRRTNRTQRIYNYR